LGTFALSASFLPFLEPLFPKVVHPHTDQAAPKSFLKSCGGKCL
jgi:hypothetical protein